MNSNSEPNHIPVLLSEVVRELNPQPGDSYLDLTAGAGGHAQAIVDIVGQRSSTLVEVDSQAIESLRLKFPKATVYHANFARQLDIFNAQGSAFNLILADLGLSSMQLNQADRGFSFNQDAPLDMRFDTTQGLSLLERLMSVDSQRLGRILSDYGQEKDARAIAKRIKIEQPQTTEALASLVVRLKAGRGTMATRRPRIHPATQTFMALRIWTNDELQSLEQLLNIAPSLLHSGGKLAIISFHSLEDRLVKLAFKDLADGDYDASYVLKTKKPIIPTPSAIRLNPRSRSAKLRVLQRL